MKNLKIKKNFANFFFILKNGELNAFSRKKFIKKAIKLDRKKSSNISIPLMIYFEEFFYQAIRLKTLNSEKLTLQDSLNIEPVRDKKFFFC